MFSIFALIVFSGFFPVVDDGSFLAHGYTIVIVCVLLLVPYTLVRFAYALGALGPRSHRIALVLTGIQLALTVVSPPFPLPGEPRTGWFFWYVVLVYFSWTVLSGMSAVGLWRTGRGQPHIVRHRLHMLATGEIVMVVALLSGSGNATPGSVEQQVTTLIGILAIYTLVLAFVVPTWLRAAWRAKDMDELAVAERALMASTSPDEVGEIVVPAVIKLFGASGGAVVASEGALSASQGLSAEEEEIFRDWAQQAGDTMRKPLLASQARLLVSRLGDGWLMVCAGRAAPVLGAGELSLIERVAGFGTLAIERGRLFEQEAISRQAAEAVNAELQTLIYSVSHDLRNPLLSIQGYLDILKEEHSGQLEEDGEHYLDRIAVNTGYIHNLIQDLLELSRIGRTEPDPTAVPIGALIDSVVQELHMLHPDCVVRVDGAFPTIWMSELRARQLLTNLLENAAKYSPNDPRVFVRAESGPRGAATIFISDNGAGIPEQYHSKAFEVFERLDAARSDISGTGMGLPICKRIMESCGGRIVIADAVAEGHSGTTMRLEFPADIVRGWGVGSAAAPVDRQHRCSRGRRLMTTKPRAVRVLLAEDNPDHAFFARRAFLTVYGSDLEMTTVADGEELLDFLQKRGAHTQAADPHLIVLDLRMPKKGGLEALSEIRNEERWKQVPIVILSSSERPEDIEASYANGANSYVTKSATLAGLQVDIKDLARFWLTVATLPDHY